MLDIMSQTKIKKDYNKEAHKAHKITIDIVKISLSYYDNNAESLFMSQKICDNIYDKIIKSNVNNLHDTVNNIYNIMFPLLSNYSKLPTDGIKHCISSKILEYHEYI
mgnify:CR=1 FL=1